MADMAGDFDVVKRLAAARFRDLAQSDMDEEEVSAFRALAQAQMERILAADPELAEAAAIGLAFLAAQKALPEGWRSVTVGPPDPDAYDKAGSAITDPWQASATSQEFFNGETENDDEWAMASGPTAQAALEALREALKAKP